MRCNKGRLAEAAELLDKIMRRAKNLEISGAERVD